MGRQSTSLRPFLKFPPSSGMMGFSLRNREPKQCQKATENTWMAVPSSTGTYSWCCDPVSSNLYCWFSGHQSLCWLKNNWWSSTSWRSNMPTATRICSTGENQVTCMAVIIFNSPCRVMTKDNIALAALLQTKEACWEGGVPPDHKVRRSFEEKNL